MRLVVIESPFAGNTDKNLRYLRAAMADCLKRGEAPFASHALYTQPGVLDDHDPEQRRLGIEAGFKWGYFAEVIAFYVDLGMSPGMIAALEHWEATRHEEDRKIEIRRIEGWK